jgi:hypothetical protein
MRAVEVAELTLIAHLEAQVVVVKVEELLEIILQEAEVELMAHTDLVEVAVQEDHNGMVKEMAQSEDRAL